MGDPWGNKEITAAPGAQAGSRLAAPLFVAVPVIPVIALDIYVAAHGAARIRIHSADLSGGRVVCGFDGDDGAAHAMAVG